MKRKANSILNFDVGADFKPRTHGGSFFTFVTVFLCLATAQVVGATDQVWQMVESTVGPNSKCINGGQATFYYSLSPDGDTRDWVVFLETGGGNCVTGNQCDIKAVTELRHPGNYMEPQRFDYPNHPYGQVDSDGAGEGLFNLNHPDYPFKHGLRSNAIRYNAAYIPYCSQDNFTGSADRGDDPLNRHGMIRKYYRDDRNDPDFGSGTVPSGVWMFRGADIIDEVIAHISGDPMGIYAGGPDIPRARTLDRNTSRFVLVGSSTSGMSAMLVFSRLRAEHRIPQDLNSRVVIASNLPFTYAYEARGLADPEGRDNYLGDLAPLSRSSSSEDAARGEIFNSPTYRIWSASGHRSLFVTSRRSNDFDLLASRTVNSDSAFYYVNSEDPQISYQSDIQHNDTGLDTYDAVNRVFYDDPNFVPDGIIAFPDILSFWSPPVADGYGTALYDVRTNFGHDATDLNRVSSQFTDTVYGLVCGSGNSEILAHRHLKAGVFSSWPTHNTAGNDNLTYAALSLNKYTNGAYQRRDSSRSPAQHLGRWLVNGTRGNWTFASPRVCRNIVREPFTAGQFTVP